MKILQPLRDYTTTHVDYFSLRDRCKYPTKGTARRRLVNRSQQLGLGAAVGPDMSALRADEAVHDDSLSAARGLILAITIGTGVRVSLIAVLDLS